MNKSQKRLGENWRRFNYLRVPQTAGPKMKKGQILKIAARNLTVMRLFTGLVRFLTFLRFRWARKCRTCFGIVEENESDGWKFGKSPNTLL